MNYALIFAGGVGRRMNTKEKPKQFLEIHGKPIIVHTIECFQENPMIDSICAVIVDEWVDFMRDLAERYRLTKVKRIIPGGATAFDSQYRGLVEISKMAAPDDVVLIHDGVRPLISSKLISDCIAHVRQFGSAVIVAPAIETIVQVDNTGMIRSTVERSECFLARAPQCFYLRDILSAHENARAEGRTFIDSTSLMLHYGNSVHTVQGPAENIKVTNPADFYICRALLDARENEQMNGINV